jgi:hypothetical protein
MDKHTIKRIIRSIAFCLFTSTSFAQNVVYEDALDSLSFWLKDRIEQGATGKKVLVEMPFVVRSLAWGCMCPNHYIGVHPNVQEGPFIHPRVPTNFPVSDSTGHSLIVRGYFTGKQIEEDYRNEDGEPAEWLYILPEFVVLDWRVNELNYDVPAPYVIREEK